mgnify:CR=1 FL=1
MNKENRFPNLLQSIILVIVFVSTLLIYLNIVLNMFSHIIKVNISDNPFFVGVALIVSFLVTCIVIMLWGKYSFKEIFISKIIEYELFLPVCLMFIGLHFLLSEINNITQYFISDPETFNNATESLLNNESKIGIFFLTVIVAPVIEEILFRGIILRGLLVNHSKALALCASALLFGLSHLDPWMIIPTGIFGLVLGWTYLKTKSVYLCMFCHSFNNLLVFLAASSEIEIPGYTTHYPDKFQPLWMDTSAIIVFIIGLIIFAKLTKNKSETLETSPSIPPTVQANEKPPVISNPSEMLENVPPIIPSNPEKQDQNQ